MLKIRRPLGRLIFNMGIAIPGKTVFLIETAPWERYEILLYETDKYKTICKYCESWIASDFEFQTPYHDITFAEMKRYICHRINYHHPHNQSQSQIQSYLSAII